MDMFDPPLGLDSKLALVPPLVPDLVEGPARPVQYVIELVGPRSVPASVAAQLVSDQWFSALGQPEAYCMAPMDQSWQRLTGRTDGSYDSLALCWDIVSINGLINRESADHLFHQLEHFGKAIGRRALPLPVPADIDRIGEDLMKIQEQLDIGVSIAVFSKAGHVSEKDLWTICSRLGLQFAPAGSFDWRVSNFPYPLFSVTPIGTTEAFSLGSVQRNATHDGVTLGFNVARCPTPTDALEGVFQAAKEIARAIDGIVSDEDGREVIPPVADEMRSALGMAVQAFDQVGIKPGSNAALKLF